MEPFGLLCYGISVSFAYPHVEEHPATVTGSAFPLGLNTIHPLSFALPL
jgi:hypothetical protein